MENTVNKTVEAVGGLNIVEKDKIRDPPESVTSTNREGSIAVSDASSGTTVQL